MRLLVVVNRWAYSLYSSVGSLDLECTDTITLDHLKRLVCVPIYLVKKDDIRNKFDEVRLFVHLYLCD